MRRKLRRILVAAFIGLAGLGGHCAETYRIGLDGSISGTFPTSGNAPAEITLQFGMPRTVPTKRWMEGDALKTLWITNGILFTQTVLMTELPSDTTATAETNSTTILLVNIEGENTNSEYTDA